MFEHKEIASPITGSTQVFLEKTIDCKSIIDTYQNWLHIDVRDYFKGLTSISIYKCQETGYRFYYPFYLEGNSNFYEELQLFPWYYKDWKWEFEIASHLINPFDLVLEIGCGRGAFIDIAQKRKAICTGLEFNECAINYAKSKGLNVLKERIQEHAEYNQKKYDFVCYFQVLEHVANVKNFIQASINILKPNGKLFICVPNNEAFIKNAKNLVTNMPPHHMGLWDKRSLVSLQPFNLKLEQLYFEPLSLKDSEWYSQVQLLHIVNKTNKIKIVGGGVRKLTEVLRHPFEDLVKFLIKFIHGHSIIGVYRKL